MLQLASIAASAAIGIGKAITGGGTEDTSAASLGSASTAKAKKTATDFE